MIFRSNFSGHEINQENCGNCRFSRHDDHMHTTEVECRRYAPSPYTSVLLSIGEMIRDVAWHQRISAGYTTDVNDEYDDVAKEITEQPEQSFWPRVEAYDWCGEWERKQ